MTEMLFRSDAYLSSSVGIVKNITEVGGIVLDRTIFYPNSGGQPGDSGKIRFLSDKECSIENTVKGLGNDIILIPKVGSKLPSKDDLCEQEINWEKRFKYMRTHTALHLLSVVIPLPVTGGQITFEKGRLDFNMPDAPEDKGSIEVELNRLITSNLSVTDQWITDDELRQNPGLVKTMSVKPPVGAGKVRLVRIGNENDQIDLQPCGGTHVLNTSEIGPVKLGKIENKGRQNRRVSIYLDHH